LFVFLHMVHCIAPNCSTFQRWLRSVNVIHVKDFANSVNVIFCLKIFLIPKSNFQGSCPFKSNLLKWNKRNVSLFLKCFWKSCFFGQRSNTRHSIHGVLVFWKQKLTHCKIKIVFFMVHCVNFNVWFRVCHLMVCDNVTFYGFQ
jgi:hypothetical protein